MDRCRGKTSTFFTKLAYGVGKKLYPAVVPLSRSLGSPAPQTSLIFELPDELILSILSYISPDPPRSTSDHAWFRIQHSWRVDDYLQQRVEFLRPLSMTCRAMRLRFLPWIWERLELPPPHDWGPRGVNFGKKFNAIANVLHVDAFMATSVKSVKMDIGSNSSTLHSFVKCLKSLPNLHTLEMGWMDDSVTIPLKKALKGVELPQIKTLVLFPTAHPLLLHCCGVEDVACVAGYQTMPHDGFLRSFASTRDSKVKRLAIPLVMKSDLSRFVAACPKLTELTVISPYPDGAQLTETGILLDPGGRARSVISELIVACKALPDFNTLQIVCYRFVPPRLACWCGWGECDRHRSSSEPWDQVWGKQTKDLEAWVIDCLKKPTTGCWDREGKKKTTLRAIKFSPGRRSIEVEECQV